MSKGYVGSKNCKDELNYSRDLDKEQLLVYLDEVELPDGMAMRMGRIQAIFWYKYKNENDVYAKLFSAKGIDIALPEGAAKAAAEAAKAETDQKPKKGLPKWIFAVGGAVVVAAIALCVTMFAGGGVSKNVKEGIKYLHGSDGYEYDPVKALELFEAEAANGDEAANFLAGYILTEELYGTLTEDYNKAFAFYEACGDNAFAQLGKSKLTRYGYGTTKDVDASENMAEEAISKIDVSSIEKLPYAAEAYEILGTGYQNSSDKDFGKAKEMFEKAAALGNVYANSKIGTLYSYEEKGVTMNLATALDYFQLAADKGNPQALRNIGWVYSSGDEKNGIAKSNEKRDEYYKKAAEKGSYTAMIKQGDLLYYENEQGERDYAAATERYLAAIANNEITSATPYNKLGYIYRDGKGLDAPDIDKAIEYFEKGAALGDTDSISCLGWIYGNSDNKCHDDKKALEYLEKAMEDNDAWAYYRMARYYFYGGDGIEIDKAKAKEYCEKTLAIKDISDDLKTKVEAFQYTMSLDAKTAQELYDEYQAARDAKEYSKAWKILGAYTEKDETNYGKYLTAYCYCIDNDFLKNNIITKDPDLANQLFDEVIKDSKGDGKGYVINALADKAKNYEINFKNNEEALKYYQQALKLLNDTWDNHGDEWRTSMKTYLEGKVATISGNKS